MRPDDILDFWFSQDPKYWFSKDDEFDSVLRDRFFDTMQDARAGNLSAWESDLSGMRALVILIDQFSRNLYRGSAEAFASDHHALRMSHELVKHPEWESLTQDEKFFAVMPMMHSEALAEQRNCLEWMEKIGSEPGVKYAKIHMEIIEKFGRFPHRNGVLGRDTTPEEQAFLDAGGFSG